MSIHRLAAATLAAVLLTNPAAHADEARSVTVVGEAISAVAPDMAVLTTGVVSQAPTAREALDGNSKAVADVVKVLLAEAVVSADIQTSGFRLQPLEANSSGNDQAPPRITGYAVKNVINVRLRDLSKLGLLLDKLVTAGANSIDRVEFVASRRSDSLDDARKAATADARRKAEIYATAAGARVGAIVSLSEEEDTRGGLGAPNGLFSPSAVPISVGQEEIRMRVTASFRLE